MKWVKLLFLILYMVLCTLAWHCLDIELLSVFLLKFVLSIPLCLMITIVIHELAHLIMFRLLGICVTEVKIGPLKVDFHFHKRKISICDEKIFRGYCSIAYPSNYKKSAIIGFTAGGISGIIESLISFCILQNISIRAEAAPFLCCLIIVGIYSFYTTLLRKKSADNRAIDKLMKDDD